MTLSDSLTNGTRTGGLITRVVELMYRHPRRIVVVVLVLVALGLLAASVALVRTFQIAETNVNRNTGEIASQQRALSYLCETVRVLDAIYVQTSAIDALIVRDPTLAPSVRNLVRQRLQVLETAHRELADTRACRQIE